MRFMFKTLGLLLVLLILFLASILGWGHIGIRRVHPPLPALEEVLAIDPTAALPVRLSYINTASQRIPRSAVLDAKLDSESHVDYLLSHAAFVLEWQDGRIFLIDTGLDPEHTAAFSRLGENLWGGDPIQPHSSVSEVLDRARRRVAGIGFTHLHPDHTGGLESLCRDLRSEDPPATTGRIPVYQTRYQLEEWNHTTRAGKMDVRRAECVRSELIVAQPLTPIPGFPGLYVIPAGGHTPGSQIFVAHVRTMPGRSQGKYSDIETWIFTGDLVNHIDGVEKDLPKPALYRWLVVPEDGRRLEVLRGYLKRLSHREGVRLLVSHDLKHIEASDLPTF